MARSKNQVTNLDCILCAPLYDHPCDGHLNGSRVAAMIMFVHPFQNVVGRLIGVETRWTSAVLLVTAPKQRVAVLAAFVENKLKLAFAKFLFFVFDSMLVGIMTYLQDQNKRTNDP